MSDVAIDDVTAGWWSEGAPLDAEEQSRKLRASMDELRAIHARFRKDRGGKLVPAEAIDRAIDELRGRTDADLD